MTEYKPGDIIVIEDNFKKLQTVLVSDVISPNRNINEIKYWGYTSGTSAGLVFRKNQVVSNDGDSKEIITDNVINQLFDTYEPISEFFKCVAIYLIRTTDKYDLQLLSKCNYLRNVLGLDKNLNIKDVLDMLNLKIQLNSGPTLSG